LANDSLTVNGTAIALGGSGTITATASGTLTIGTGLGGTSYNGSTGVTITNTGVTSIVAGTNIAVSGATGAVTVSVTGTVPTATSATTAGTVTTAAQGNITSVGTLTSLSVTGNIDGGNLRTAGLISATGAVTGSQFNGSGAGLSSIPGANVSGTVSSATNSSTVGGFTPSQTNGVVNRVVVADASGYINNNYFNSTDNSVASGVTAVMVKQGDNYFRSGTAAAIATFISGQSMNISGSATTAGTVTTAAQGNITSLGTLTGLTVSGTVNATVFNTTSDQNLKENIKTIENPSDKIAQIRGVNFTWKDSKNPSMGVIAQEVETVLPSIVATDSKTGTKSVSYDGIIGLLIEVVKDQQKSISLLESKINSLSKPTNKKGDKK
jgi:hypothetical protein